MRKLLLNPTPLFRKLRQLSMLLSLLMPAMVWGQTTYDIWIGDFENNGSFTGTQVTSANATDVLGNGTVSYADGVLTLNGANIQGTIYIKESLTIDLKGKNYITANDSSAITNINNANSIGLTFKSTDGTGFLTTVAKPTNYPCSSGFNEATYDNGLSCLSGGLRFADGAYEYAAIGQHLFSGGTGVSGDDPYLIATAADLKDFSSYVNQGWITTNGKYFKLSPSSGSTIDCTGLTGFQPIGIEGNEPIKFKGTFDGNKKTIKNLSITGIVGAYVGLFRCLDGGTITQLTLDGCTISGGTSSSDNIGGIVGNVSSGTVSNCIVQNSAISCSENSQNPYVGGIVGALEGGEITGCVFQDSYVKAEPSANSGGINSYAGGIVGNAAGGTISNCQVKGTAEISAICTNQSTYAGAIAGNRIGVTLSNNTYDSSVKTKVQNSTITELTTYSGYTERGIGSAPGSSSSDEIGKVELAGTKKIAITQSSTTAGEFMPKAGTYYLSVDNRSNNTYDVYALPGNEVGINANPNEGYKPRLTLSDENINVSSVEIDNNGAPTLTTGAAYDHTEFTFTMPNADVTATLSFIIDLSSDSYTYTIADAIYTGAAQTSQAVSLSQNDDAITPFTLGTHYTIEGYKDADKHDLESAPQNVGTYYATIKGVEANGFTGTRDVQFNITKANLNIVTIAAIDNQTYTGSEIKPEISVTLNGEAVAADGNFSIAYSNNTNISSATVRGTVTLTALATSGCFTEGTTKIATFLIIPKSIEGVTVTLSGDGFDSEKKSFVYNGQNQTPTVTVKDGERLLVLDTDYTLTNNGGVGVADNYSVTVTGKGNYDENTSVDVTYGITPRSIKETTINLDATATYAYTGWEHKPEPVVKYGDTELVKDQDYTLSYSNNINAAASTAENAPTVTITGKGNFDENTTESRTFTINQADLAEAAISKIAFGGKDYTVGGEAIEIEYTGEAIHPTVEEVKYNDGTVTLDASEYTVSWGEHNTELSSGTESAQVIITSTGKNFTAGTSTSLNFKIVAANVEITAPDQTVVYNGNKQAYTKATVNNENAKLSITYYATAEDRTNGTNPLAEAPTNADTYYIKVTQTDGHYTADPKDATFTIEQLSINGATITLNKTVLTYNETEQAVNVTKVMIGELEVPATSYEVSGNVQTLAGEHTVTVTAKPNGDAFKNNFKGSATTTFTIKDRTAEINFASGLSYMTYYKSDENFLIPDGVTAYIITGVGETTVTVKKMTYLKANTPLLLEKTDGSTIEKDPNESFDENKLVYANADVATTGNEYVLYKNEFVKATKTITQGKCYLNLTGAAPSRGMYGIDNDGSTAINSASLNDNEEMINDNWYDLQGRRIAKPTKAGLYIKNGKKMVINNK